jgi:hypothetical protein
MPAVTVQFHMLFDELVGFISDMMRDYSLAIELEPVFKLPEFIKNATSPPSWLSRQGRWSRSDERAVSQRFDGQAMATFATAVAQGGEARQASRLSTMDSQCDLVCQSNGVSVAFLAA